MKPRATRALLQAALLLAALAAAADTPLPQARHDALDAAGPQAAQILQLWDVFLALCTAVFLAIVAVLAIILWRRPRAGEGSPPDLSTVNRPEPGPRLAVTAAVGLSLVGLLTLITASFFTDRALDRLPLAGAVNIELTGHQWWWSARYRTGGPSDEMVTANELHIPVGRPVLFTLRSSDVIHSLWIPNLAGKKDLIPGRTALLQLRADQPGIYRGQCAEFCGLQHALMGLVVVAEPPEQFEAWLQAQRAPAAPPTQARAQRGQAVFESASCALCHAIQGTTAQGKRAPDLTHIASRKTLAAGALPNTREAMARWITKPQDHKPGTNMPPTPLSPEDLDALLAYLEGLK